MQPLVEHYTDEPTHQGGSGEQKCQLGIVSDLRPTSFAGGISLGVFLLSAVRGICSQLLAPRNPTGLVAFDQLANADGIALAVAVAGDRFRASGRVNADF